MPRGSVWTMAVERRRFPEIDLVTERLIEDLVDHGRATFAKRPWSVSVDDWSGLSGGERQQILVARAQAEAYLGHSGTARPGNRMTSTVAVYRRTPAQQRSGRRLKYLRSHTGYAQVFGGARTAHLEAYKYWHLPRRLGAVLAVAVFTAAIATGLDWKLSASSTVALIVVWLFVEPVLVKVRAARLGASFAAAREQSRHIPARLRDQVLSHDGRRCRKCGSRDVLSVDHVVPYSRGGPTEFSNLRTLCMPCNIKKGNRRPTRIARYRSAHRRPRRA